jgi:hypothetical protein
MAGKNWVRFATNGAARSYLFSKAHTWPATVLVDELVVHGFACH